MSNFSMGTISGMGFAQAQVTVIQVAETRSEIGFDI
jgi:hypothetical protein